MHRSKTGQIANTLFERLKEDVNNVFNSNRSTPSNKKHYFVRGDHTEVVEIDYDPKIISYEELLRLFWDNHEYGVTAIIKRQV